MAAVAEHTKVLDSTLNGVGTVLICDPYSKQVYNFKCNVCLAPFLSPCNVHVVIRRVPTIVTVHPVAIFSILDHYLRRTDAQDRVIGTLLGTRTETEIEIRSSFAVLHSETSEQVAVDMEYHRTMYELHHKVSPKEVIVGWYAWSLLLAIQSSFNLPVS